MNNTIKKKVHVRYIAKPELLDKYPARYRRDTEKYPQLLHHLYRKDDRVLIVSDPCKKVYTRQDIIFQEDLFYEFSIENMDLEINASDDFSKLAIEKDLGLDIGDMADIDLDELGPGHSGQRQFAIA